jgi:hypothetical protein
MKRVGLVVLTMLALALLCSSAMAQDTDTYLVTYYSNNVTAAPPATVRVINDGYEGVYSSPPGDGTAYADFFVFDDSEELITCCSCAVTPDGLLSENIPQLVTQKNAQTGATIRTPSRGVIKLLSSSNGFFPQKGDPEPAAEVLSAGLHAWATHIQSVKNETPNGPAPYSQTETLFADANLTTSEQSLLEFLCWAQVAELSIAPCSCTPEDYDF